METLTDPIASSTKDCIMLADAIICRIFLGTNIDTEAYQETVTPTALPLYSNATQGAVFDFAGGKGINIDGNLGSTSSSKSFYVAL